MTEATKTIPAPLDAYETAKPDEPIWVVQGGDPLGAPLIRVWAHFARIRAGAITANTVDDWCAQLIHAAGTHEAESDTERDDLLIRATQTEEISWAMDDYLSGDSTERIAAVKRSAMERMDIHDTRKRCAQLISNFFCELTDFRERLREFGFMYESLDYAMFSAIEDLKMVKRAVEVRKH